MALSTLTYVLNNIRAEIPRQLLELAFNPQKYSTSIEQRIISTVVEGCILQDTNLVGGKKRDISISQAWLLDLRGDASNYNGLTVNAEGAYYLIPPEAREGKNISSVIGFASPLGSAMPGSGGNSTGGGNFGNTTAGLASQMLNTYTMSQYPVYPQVSLEGSNIIRFYPELVVEGTPITVMLEYDAEFLNANTSTIMALRNLTLCAVKRYIATNLIIPIDESQVVAGMEIGVIKRLVEEYAESAKEYNALLLKVRGAHLTDVRSLSRLIYHAL